MFNRSAKSYLKKELINCGISDHQKRSVALDALLRVMKAVGSLDTTSEDCIHSTCPARRVLSCARVLSDFRCACVIQDVYVNCMRQEPSDCRSERSDSVLRRP